MPDEDRRRVVVVNSTPIITLAIVDQLDLLRDLYDTVLIPAAVRLEVQAGGPTRAGAPRLAAPPWIKSVELRDPHRVDLLSDLDRGEAEVVALAQERGADLVVIDERLGRRHARRLGISLTGTLGVLLKAKREGLLSEIGPVVRAIRQRAFDLVMLWSRKCWRLPAKLDGPPSDSGEPQAWLRSEAKAECRHALPVLRLLLLLRAKGGRKPARSMGVAKAVEVLIWRSCRLQTAQEIWKKLGSITSRDPLQVVGTTTEGTRSFVATTS